MGTGLNVAFSYKVSTGREIYVHLSVFMYAHVCIRVSIPGYVSKYPRRHTCHCSQHHVKSAKEARKAGMTDEELAKAAARAQKRKEKRVQKALEKKKQV